MSWVGGLAKFLYDLIVGDSWLLTATVASNLSVGVLVLWLDALPPVLLTLVIAAGLLLGVPLAILIEAKRHLRRARE